MVETLSPLNPNYAEAVAQAGPSLGLSDPDGATAVIYRQVQQQAEMLSYIDVFHGFMIFVLLVLPLGLLIRQGKSAGGHA